MWRGGSAKCGYPRKQADLALGVRLSFVRFVPLQVSVVKLQRLDNKICFLSFGNGFRNELGYPFITESRLFLLVWLFFLHNGLDNLVRQFSVKNKRLTLELP